MKKDEVIALLEKNKNERGMAHWERIGIKGLSSFGMGLTQLKKLAKGIGKDHELAQELWNTTIYDARTMSILIEEPRKVSREQVEE